MKNGNEAERIRYFLGANAASGFYSLYESFPDGDAGDFLWVLKGGPGCGKSSFMRRIARAAEAAGMTVEYILCSGDPSSLDGVHIREARCAYVDGTAPHLRETPLPGAAGLYLDLGAFYRPEALRLRRAELFALTEAYRSKYARAYALLRAAGLSVSGLSGPDEGARAAVCSRAAALAKRLLPRGAGYRERRRFLSAFTRTGDVFLWETAALQCPRVCTLDNELGLAPLFLEELRAQCESRGLEVVLCPDPLFPARAEALLVPGAETAFIAVTRARPWPGEVWRHLRLDAMAAKRSRESREESRAAAKLQTALLSKARESLVQAGELHDALESAYNPHVDFAGLYELSEAHIDYILGRLE